MHTKDYIANLPAVKTARPSSQATQTIVRMAANENALGPSPLALAAVQTALATLHRYPDAAALQLREALAKHAGLAPEMVLCTNGSDELILLICLAFLREGDDAVMAQGTFISYQTRTLEMGARTVQVPLHDYTHELPALLAAITPRTRLLFVCNPNNPTGTSNGASAIREFLDQVPDDVLVVMDEAYIEFATRPDYPDLLPDLRAGRRNLLLIRTFAKIYGLAGLRLGYAYGHPDVIAYLDRTRPIFNVNVLAQIAGIAALADSEHVARSRAHAAASRAFFMRELSTLGLQPIPSETNFMAVPVGNDIAVAEALREHGFAVNPLTSWGLPGLIRVSFGTEEENQAFIAALSTVLQRR